jgi:cytochrome c oxidase subunit II
MVPADFGLPEPATDQGAYVAALWTGAMWTAIVVGGITLGLILWAAIRYRARDDSLPVQREYHVPLEIAYTAIPVVIVAVLFGFTVRAQHRVLAHHRPDVVVEVTGFQWGWGFRFDGSGKEVTSGIDPPEIVLPVGRPVRFRVTATDVIHSFYLPRFLFKYDAIPGRTNEFDVTIDVPGRYEGRCAEFCGVAHGQMDFVVRAVTPAEFDAWLVTP